MYWLLFHNASKQFYIISKIHGNMYIYLLLDEFEVGTVSYEPRFYVGHKSMGKKQDP